MRIAVMTDVHANLPALRAALGAIRGLGVDAVYHTGDAIGIGPQPAEVLDALLSEPGLRLLMGNHDEWFVTGLPERPVWMTPGERRHIAWVHEQLDPALRAVVGAWPYEAEETAGDVRVKLLHYPLDGGGFAKPRTLAGAGEADALFTGGDGAGVVFYGHHHPFSDLQGRARYVNPGALGCHTEPVARFAVLEADGAAPYRLTFHAVPYDPAPLVAEFRRRNVPEADFILRNFMPLG